MQPVTYIDGLGLENKQKTDVISKTLSFLQVFKAAIALTFTNCRESLFYPRSPNYCEPTLSSTFFCKTASSPFSENLIKSLIS